MKILFLTRLFHPYVGGVEKHVLEVTKRLEALGHEVTIVTEALTSSQTQQGANSSGPGINASIYHISVGQNEKGKKFLIWKWLWKHKQLIKDADVIHAHDVFFWFLPFRFLYPRKKIFTTFHGYESYPIKKKAILYRKLFEKLSSGSVCVGEFMKKWYHARPDYIFYGGVSPEQKPLKKTKHASAVFIGRLDDQTGIETYVNSIKKIREYAPDFILTVYGDGPYRKKIENIEDVVLKGFDPSASEYLSEFHYAFISRYLAILEALIQKLPVIAVYDNPVKKDYLLMTPFSRFITVAENEDEVVQKMKDLFLNPNRARRMVESGYQWAEKQTWDSVVQTYLKLWIKK